MSRRYASACTVMISLVVMISRDFELQLKSSGHATHTAIHFKRNDPGSRRPSRRYASACTVIISLVVVISRDFESQLKSSGHATHGMTLDPGAPGDSNWTFRLSPVVSAMLSGVVGACMCGLYVVVCVAGALMCITVTFFLLHAARC